jgi:hypothetical protein
MTRTELIIQLLKVAIALAFGAFFVWWSLQVQLRRSSVAVATSRGSHF